jgi:N-acetylneuraminic acid mutarotase
MLVRSALRVSFALVAVYFLSGCGARTALDLGTVAGNDSGSDVGATLPLGTAVLFGGSGPTGPLFADTWTWDGSAWAKLDVTGPSARYGAVMASFGGELVLFGGFNHENETLSDTWTWDGLAWTERRVAGPPARYDAVMAPLGGGLVLFGGYHAYLADVLTDTWTWDGSAWTQLDVMGPLPPRGGSSMAPLGSALVFFGGEEVPNGYLSDTWTWNGGSWTKLDVTGPPARQGAVMGSLGSALVLFGGYDDGYDADAGTPFPDTWTWDGSRWTELGAPGPPDSNLAGRESPAMAKVGDTLVLFGGGTFDGSPWFSDTWTFDGSTWTRLDVHGPSARAGAVMATR